MARTKRRPKTKPAAERLVSVRKQIDFAREHRVSSGVDGRWRQAKDAYQGLILGEDGEWRDRVVVNYAFSVINTIWPNTSIETPTISVLPEAPNFEHSALLQEKMLQHEYDKMDAHSQVRLAALDWLFYGIGWIKVGWEFVEEAVDYDDQEKQAEFIRRWMENETIRQTDPEAALGLPSDAELVDEVSGMRKQTVITDDPWLERVSPFDVFVDAEAVDWQSKRWIAQRMVRTVEEVQRNPEYDGRHEGKLVRSGVRAEEVLHGVHGLDPKEVDTYRDEVERCVVWEFYDCVSNEMMVFTETSPGFLIAPKPIPYAAGVPFVPPPRLYVVPDEFYPLGELDQILPLVEELSETRTQLLNQRRNMNRKMIGDPKFFDEEGMAALESDSDMAVAWITQNSAGNLDQAIRPLAAPPMQADLYAMTDVITGNIHEVSGVSEYQFGQTPDTRQTATEAAMIQDATNGRTSEKLGQFELFIARTAEKLMATMQQFMTAERWVRYHGSDGRAHFFEMTPELIKGDYTYKVQAGSTQPTNETTRRTNAMTMMQSTAPFIQMGIVNPVPVAEHMLTEGFGVDASKFMTPQAVQELALRRQAQDAGPQPVEAQAEAVGGVPELQGELGVNAPQPDPLQLLQFQQAAAQDTVPGVPNSLTDQLVAQTGFSPSPQ